MTSGDAQRKQRLVTPAFALVVLSTFAYFLCVGMLLPTFPRFIEGPLGGSDVAVGLSGGAFSLTAVVLRPIAGRMGDKHGRRPLLVIGSTIVAVSVLANTIVETLPLLMVLRLLSGVGEGLFFVGAAAAINDLAPEERRGEAVSLFSLSLYGGISMGPILGESLLDATDFTTLWWVAAAIGAVATVLAIRVRDARPERGTGGPSRLVHPAAVLPGLVLMCTVWGFAAFSSFVSLYALELGMSGSRFVFFTYSFTVLLIRLFGARIPDVLGPRRSATIAASTCSAGLLVMAAWQQPIGLYVGAFIFGFGQAFAFPALMLLAIRGAPAFERGAVVGTYSAFVDLAFGIGALSLGPVAHALGYPATFAVSTAIAMAGLILLRTRVREPRGGEPTPEIVAPGA
ncbi:MAG TPA: MFS transporter [Actinomycetota bacterium]|nr:MFS transporter [Actinomycetota bacterium]